MWKRKAKGAQTEAEGNGLPDELWIHILSFLQSAEDLCSLCLVCKTFDAISADDALWSPLLSTSWDNLGGETNKQIYLRHLRDAITHRRELDMLPGYVPHFKVVLLGAAGVGKSSLVSYLMTSKTCDTEATSTTLGAAFCTKDIIVDGTKYILDIWDTGGQERFRSLSPMYYRGAHGALLVTAVNDQYSFARAKDWEKEILRTLTTLPVIYIVGNKCDLPYDENIDELSGVKELRQAYPYYETSAKTGHNISAMFEDLGNELANPCRLVWQNGTPPHVPSKEALLRKGVRAKLTKHTPMGDSFPEPHTPTPCYC